MIWYLVIVSELVCRREEVSRSAKKVGQSLLDLVKKNRRRDERWKEVGSVVS